MARLCEFGCTLPHRSPWSSAWMMGVSLLVQSVAPTAWAQAVEASSRDEEAPAGESPSQNQSSAPEPSPEGSVGVRESQPPSPSQSSESAEDLEELSSPTPQPEAGLPAAPPKDDAPPPAPSRDSGAQDQGKMVVTGQSMEGYSVFDASSATKTDTPIMETPQSIQVVPRAVLSDQMVVDVDEVLENVSSVQAAGANQTGLVTSFVARGFALSPLNNFYKNGRPFVFSAPPPTEAVQRLEFVKGPASVLYGQAEPGGIVNLSLKRPTRRFFAEPRVQYGRFRHFKGILDTGGPLGRSLGYRLNASYTNAKSFRALQHVRQFVGAGSFLIRIAPRWELVFDGSYQQRVQHADSGLSVMPAKEGEDFGKTVVDVPISRSLNEPWAQVDVAAAEVGYELSGEISPVLELTHSSSVQRQENDELRADPRPILSARPESGFSQGDMGKLYRVRNTQRLSLYSDVLAKADMESGRFRHRVLAGVEFFQSVRGVTESTPMSTRTQDFNIYNPRYTREPPPTLGDIPIRLGRSTLRQFGVFAQEQLTFDEWAHLLLSARYDRFFDSLDASRLDMGSASIIHQNSGSPTFRAGGLVQPWESASFFASYSQGFRPNLDPFANEQLAPQRSQQGEGGVKLSMFQGYLTGTLTGYYLAKRNVVIVNAVSQTLTIAGLRDASGLEADLVGEVIPGLNLLVGYSFLHARIRKGDPRPEDTKGVGTISTAGNIPPASPSHSGRIWASYRFKRGPKWIQAFRVGAGMQARSEVQGDVFNTLSHEGYVRFDAMAGWRKQVGAVVLDAQVNVKNLTDQRYFNSTVRNFIKPGAPLSIIGQLGARFGRKKQ